MSNKLKVLILGGGFGGLYTALRLDKTLARRADVEVTLVRRLAKKMRVAISWVLEIIFSKDLEQMLTVRDVELISRIGTSLRSDIAD